MSQGLVVNECPGGHIISYFPAFIVRYPIFDLSKTSILSFNTLADDNRIWQIESLLCPLLLSVNKRSISLLTLL